MRKSIVYQLKKYFNNVFPFFLLFSFLISCSTSKENYSKFLKLEGSKFVWEIDLSLFFPEELISRLEYSPEEFKKIIINYYTRNEQVHTYTLSLLHSDMLVFPLMEKTSSNAEPIELDKEYNNLVKEFRSHYSNLSSLEIERKNENDNISLERLKRIIADPTPASAIYRNEGKAILDRYLNNKKWIIPTNRQWSNHVSYITFSIGLLILYKLIKEFKTKSKSASFLNMMGFLFEKLSVLLILLIFFGIAYNSYQSAGFQTVELNNKSFNLSYSKFFEMNTQSISFDTENIKSISFNPVKNEIEFEAILNETKSKQVSGSNSALKKFVWELDRTDFNHKERILVAHYICGEIYKRTNMR